MNHWLVDFDLHSTLKLEMAEGRWFSREFLSDTLGAVINEAAADAFGMEEPVGKSLVYLGGAGEGDIVLQIIGIAKDFNYESIHHDIHPLVMTFLPPQYAGYLIARIAPQNYPRTLGVINRTWKEFVPVQPFDYTFLEDDLITVYHDDFRTGKIFTIFTVLAVFISILGLIGMASYNAVQRTKEIGVRKVMGAQIPLIIRMLSKEVFIHIGIATLVSWPLGYFLMRNWLQNFAFRVEPGMLSFLLASVFALILAVATVGIRAYFAASANPADSLRYE
jgi:putative ABC transport system permease protein